jgi:GTPase SAR1 family protein
MYREKYVNALRAEIVETVANHFTPKAMRYGYSELPLEANIKWRPIVLFIGNYSSGKSSLINELIGGKIQKTGQAPTDDSFTVITYDDSVPVSDGIRVVEERDGKALINDPEYPFLTLRKQGQRFASHFKLKKVNSPFLKDLAIIDTPGMLDSITERDRGYDYQEVVGDLAQKAGLVLVLFDAHKAGTVREAYKSIRETLTARTFEDRIIFVLNRIDECTSFSDLLRVYGTLCWNLSQITGRKDIPLIHLTYSPNESPGSDRHSEYLPLLENQREELRQAILHTPLRRLDHLASFVEVHGERLGHYLEALLSYHMAFRKFRMQKTFTGILTSILGGLGTVVGMMSFGLGGLGLPVLAGFGGVAAAVVMLGWVTAVQRRLELSFHQKKLEDIDSLTSLEDQTRKDSWEAIRELVRRHLEKKEGGYSIYELKRDMGGVHRIYDDAAHEIREALSALASFSDDDADDFETPILSINSFKKQLFEIYDEEVVSSLRYIY